MLIKEKLELIFIYQKKKYLFSKIIKNKNIIVLIDGSHGFKFLENSELIEVKQGPFNSKIDKRRFLAIDEKRIKIK